MHACLLYSGYDPSSSVIVIHGTVVLDLSKNSSG